MQVRTNSGRNYFYSTSSNRLSTRLCEESNCAPIHFDASSEYDFTRIGMFTIEITQECNLRCSYCCYSGEYSNRRKHNSTILSSEDMVRCVDLICEHSASEVPIIYVAFYGGEALLCLEKIEWLIKSLTIRGKDINFEFSISTNGILLTPQIIDKLCSVPNLFITITIDGNKEMHDKNRKTSSGKGSFDVIMSNLRDFKTRYPIVFKNRVRFISTVKSIQDLIPLNDFWINHEILFENRPQHIACIIPNFEKGDKVSDNKQKYERVYDLAIESIQNGCENILTDELYNLIKLVKNRNYSIQPNPLVLSTCINIPNSCFISSEGNLYACERLCPPLKMGTIYTGFDAEKCDELNQRYIRLKNKYCGTCWARRLCRRCAVSLNFTEEQFTQYCQNERMQIELALRYFCELLEIKRGLYSKC